MAPGLFGQLDESMLLHADRNFFSFGNWCRAADTARDGAWVAELAGNVLDEWPDGMRLIIRKERPRAGAQLRITDADGLRLTCFATNTVTIPVSELGIRHRIRARYEERIRNARATGLRNLPCTTPPRRRSGLRSSNSHSISSSGCRRLP